MTPRLPSCIARSVALASTGLLAGCLHGVPRPDEPATPSSATLDASSIRVVPTTSISPAPADAAAAPPAQDATTEAMRLIQAGALQAALTQFRQAVADHPSSSRLRNNLGFALMLAGRPEEAFAQLERAVDLDPNNTTASRNLLEIARRFGKPAASAPGHPVASADVVETPVAGASASVARLTQLAPQVYRLETVPRSGAASTPQTVSDSPAPSTPPDSAPSASGTDRASSVPAYPPLMISNGNGRTGLAAQFRSTLAQKGFVTRRLANLPGYPQRRTEILHLASHHDSASLLARSIGEPVALREVPRAVLPADVGMHLLLGRDLLGVKAPSAGTSLSATPVEGMQDSARRPG